MIGQLVAGAVYTMSRVIAQNPPGTQVPITVSATRDISARRNVTTTIWRRALGAAAAAAAALAVSTAGTGVANAEAPVVGTENPTAISGQYIVVMRPGASANANRIAAAAAARSNGAEILSEYSAALQGFAARLPQRALDALRGNPNVDFIEADQVMSLTTTQTGAPWGLDRVDQRNLPLSTTYTYTVTGAGVTAYVIDTGIRFSHTQFGGRAVSGFDAIDGGSADDCNGHGTHVSGTVGGSTYGMAKAVSIVGVRVLNCRGSGSNSQVINGINWVTGDHDPGELAVANMSLGGSPSNALDNAVRNSIADGITYAIAAGNNNGNACNQSPARVAEAITVGSTTRQDARSYFSNKGTCVDIFAPGSSIKSAWHNSDTATKIISGTSMASPHVAGAAVLYLQQNPASAPLAVRNGLVNNATVGVINNVGTGSPNLLLFTG